MPTSVAHQFNPAGDKTNRVYGSDDDLKNRYLKIEILAGHYKFLEPKLVNSFKVIQHYR
jgi:hypothetical protein